MKTLKFRLGTGFFVWLTWAVFYVPLPLEPAWGRLLVLFAPLVVVPLTLDVLARNQTALPPSFFAKLENWQLPAALAFAAAYFLPAGKWAGLLSLPWLAFTAGVAWGGFTVAAQFLSAVRQELGAPSRQGLTISTLGRAGQADLAARREGSFGLASGMVYLLVGGVWAVSDRFGLRPLNYDAEIVFLTVAHFHYAGFVLPIVAGLAAHGIKNWTGEAAVLGIVTGVLLVAVGIVSTHLGGSPAVETLAAWWLALSAVLLAGIHFYLAMRPNVLAEASLVWALAGASLLFGMALAGLYGMRHTWAFPGLDIAWMRALHGSANVFGFSLLSILGWRFCLARKK